MNSENCSEAVSGRLDIEEFKLTRRQVNVATSIRDAVEAARVLLIKKYPGWLRPGGLLDQDAMVQQPSRFASASWDEILMSDTGVVIDAAARCSGTTFEVISCARILAPENWQAVSYAWLFEKTFAELWEIRSSEITIETRKKVLSEHGKDMARARAAQRREKSPQGDVLDCLKKNGNKYKTKQAFINDMLAKYGEQGVRSQKTIERWIADSEIERPVAWRRRVKK